MKRTTVATLALIGFGLILVSFVIRGFGQLLLGSRTALLLAGPVALLAAAVIVTVIAIWGLSVSGVIAIDGEE